MFEIAPAVRVKLTGKQKERSYHMLRVQSIEMQAASIIRASAQQFDALCIAASPVPVPAARFLAVLGPRVPPPVLKSRTPCSRHMFP